MMRSAEGISGQSTTAPARSNRTRDTSHVKLEADEVGTDGACPDRARESISHVLFSCPRLQSLRETHGVTGNEALWEVHTLEFV